MPDSPIAEICSNAEKRHPEPPVETKTQAPADSATRRIAQTILSNTVMLGCDFLTTSMPYGMALKAEALVRKPSWRDFLKASEWKEAYQRSWSVLKYGFYPTFLMEVAVSETTKQFGSPMVAHYSDIIMPALIGAGTAPAVSLAAINARFKLQLDLIQILRQQGPAAVAKMTGGPCAIGLREALCFYALHHDTTNLAKRIADGSSNYQTTSFLFRHHDGSPTMFSKLLASSPDGLALLAGQPLTMFAVNAATTKYRRQLQYGAYAPKPKLTSPIALLKWQLNFGQEVCKAILEEGKNNKLSSFLSFSPGIVLRTGSLFGTLTVFKYGLEPVKNAVGENITHRKKASQ